MSDDDRQYPGPFKREDPQYMEALREKDARIQGLLQECREHRASPHPGIKRVADALWAHIGGEEKVIDTRCHSVLYSIGSFLACLADCVNNAEDALDVLDGLIYGLEREDWLKAYTPGGIERAEKALNERRAAAQKELAEVQEASATLERMRAAAEN